MTILDQMSHRLWFGLAVSFSFILLSSCQQTQSRTADGPGNMNSRTTHEITEQDRPLYNAPSSARVQEISVQPQDQHQGEHLTDSHDETDEAGDADDGGPDETETDTEDLSIQGEFLTEDYPLDWDAEQYRWHVQYGWRFTDWSGDRDTWTQHRTSFGYNRPGGGLYNVEARRVDRVEDIEYQYGADLYPPLWGRAYANINYMWSPDPVTVPRNDVQVTVYQPISKSWKIYPGYRHASFKSDDVDVVSLGVAHYIGNWFLRSRVQYSDESDDRGATLDLSARYYFSRDHRLEFGGSFGEETVGYFEDDTVEHQHTEIYRARYDYYFTDNFGFDIEARYRSMDELPVARMGLITLKYRFGAFTPE